MSIDFGSLFEPSTAIKPCYHCKFVHNVPTALQRKYNWRVIMGRKILGGILGYVVMFVVVFTTFTIAYLAMGSDTAFLPGTYEVSMTWILVSSILGLVAAVVGGYVAGRVGGKGAVKVTAGIVLVLGLLLAIATALFSKPTEIRPADVPNMEAMSKAQTPVWVAFLNPVIGIVGVLIGGSLRKSFD